MSFVWQKFELDNYNIIISSDLKSIKLQGNKVYAFVLLQKLS